MFHYHPINECFSVFFRMLPMLPAGRDGSPTWTDPSVETTKRLQGWEEISFVAGFGLSRPWLLRSLRIIHYLLWWLPASYFIFIIFLATWGRQAILSCSFCFVSGAPGSGLSPWRPQLEGRPSSSYASFSLSGKFEFFQIDISVLICRSASFYILRLMLTSCTRIHGVIAFELTIQRGTGGSEPFCAGLSPYHILSYSEP